MAGVVALAVWAGGLAGCSDSPAAPATLGGIAGAVREGSTGVAGATLTLSGGASRTATSAASGSFSFTDLAAGAYSVALTPPAGFGLASGEAGTRSVTVVNGQTAAVNFAVVTLGGANPGSISGTVRNGQAGVSGASLALTGNGVTRSTATVAGGTYSFADLVPGAYLVTITPPAGFQLGTGEVAAKNATVTAGQSATVDFALAPVSGGNVQVINISGITFNPSSVTIARGTTVRWVNGTTVFHTVTPDGNTEWTSANLNPGTQFEHTFNTAGTFNYFCTPHHSLGMVGTINVQ